MGSGARLSEELGFLVGHFSGEEQLHPSRWAAAGAATVTATGSSELGGELVVHRHHEVRDDGGSFDLMSVFMRSPLDGELLLYAFDTAGYPPEPPARGRWDGEHLVLERTTERGRSRTTYALAPDGYRWAKDFTPPGEDGWEPVVSGALQRVPEPGENQTRDRLAPPVGGDPAEN